MFSQFHLKQDVNIHNPVYQLAIHFVNLQKSGVFALEKYQWQRLTEILQHAKEHSFFYKEKIPNQLPTTKNEFEKNIPLLTRSDLQNHFSDICTKNLPPSIKVTGSIFSSGSTGTPLEVLQTNLTQIGYRVSHLRDLDWCQWNITKSLAAIKYFYNTNTLKEFYPHWDLWIDQMFYTGSSFCLDIHTDPYEQKKWLRKVNPSYLITYPSNLEALLEIDGLSQLSNLIAIKSMSEPLSEETRTRAEYYAKVCNTYSAQELGYIASECCLGQLHIHSEVNYVEIINDDNSPCGPGEPGRVIVTNLLNHASPLIRYELGDRAAFGPPCACGLLHPVLEKIEGKIIPLFLLPNGKRKSSQDLAIALRKMYCFKQFQAIQSKHGLTLNVILNTNWNTQKENALSESINQFFECKMDFTLNIVERLTMRSGKIRHLICDINE